MNNKKVLLLILSLIVFVFVACSNKVSKLSDSEIIVNLSVEPKTIDPSFNAQIYGVIYIQHVFEGLTTRDKNNKVVEGVAESWDISQDGKIYTFHLRTNSLWSDGKPVVAEDFVYSWRREVDPVVASEFSYQHEAVKNARDITAGKKPVETLGVKAIDDYTLEVELEAPTAYFLELTAFPTYAPLRKDIIEKYGDKWTLSPESYIGNGPYKMTERLADQKIVFSVNTNYYSKEEQIAKEITFIIMSDPNTAVAGLKNGTIHFSALEPPAAEIENLKSEGYIAANYGLGTYYLELNITNEALKDKRVRQALALAIDRNYIVSNVTKGGQIPAGAFVPTQVRGLNGTFRSESGDYIDINNYEENIKKAKSLMSEAGYPNGENYPILELKVSPGIYVLVGEAIQQMWKDNLNITVQLIIEDFPITLQSLIEKNYQLSRMGWTGDYNDPMTMLDVMLSYGGINHSGFANANYDRLILMAKQSPDNKVRMDAMRQAESILIDEMPIIPLYYRADALMINPKLKGVVLNPLGRHKFNYCYIE